MLLLCYPAERELSEDLSCQSDESSDTSDNESESDTHEHMKRRSSSQNINNNNNNSKPGHKRNGSNASNGSNKGIFASVLGSLLENHPLLKSIDGRAATVHNFMRGLSLYKAYPFSPFTSLDERRKMEDKLEGMLFK